MNRNKALSTFALAAIVLASCTMQQPAQTANCEVHINSPIETINVCLDDLQAVPSRH